MKAIALVPSRVGILGLLWLVGLYLRLPILVAPPLAPAISSELGLNQSQVGAMTTIPVLMLALGALPGSFAIARFGPAATVVMALVLLALSSAGRALAPPTVVLFLCTVLLGFAIAVMQPALPVLVRRWCPEAMALGSAVYMNGLLVGEFVGAGLTLPFVMPLVDGSWRASLVFWSVPALAVAAAVYVRGGRTRDAASPDDTSEAVPWNPPWHEARVWKLGTVLGAASAAFFGTNAYLGSVLRARGAADQLAGVLFYFNAAQVLGSLLMLVLARLLVGRRWPVTLIACVLPLCLLVSATASGGLFTAAVFLVGLCTCLQLILMVSLVPEIASEREVAPLAAGMFAVGYLLAFLVPLAGGVLADASGRAVAALLPGLGLAIIAAVVALAPGFGHRAAREEPQPGDRDVR